MGRDNNARGWTSVGKYIQGAGEFGNIFYYTKKIGSKAVAIIDEYFYEDLSRKLNGLAEDNGVSIASVKFNSEVTETLIDKLSKDVLKSGADVIIGIGGGKSIDVAKGIAYKTSNPVIIVPTIASTDAPTSGLSVIYEENGKHKGEWFYNFNPEIVIVDSEIINKAPVRFLISGMGDALATLFEAEANWNSDTPNLVYNNDGGYKPTCAARAIAAECYKVIRKYGASAKIAAENHIINEAFENVVEANILLSGLGFENNATAGAHSVADGITALKEGAQTMHGEKVAFGVLCQLIIENRSPEFISDIYNFCLSVGLPVTLEDLHIDATDENIRQIAENSMHSCWDNEPFAVNVGMVVSAVKTADAYGQAIRAGGKIF